MNVFSRSLKAFKELPTKGCREIRFSNGGHLFATTSTQGVIQVYKFYTAECPKDLEFRLHMGRVRSIAWFDDDSGFASGGWDGFVYVWSLKNNSAPVSTFKVSNINFNSVAKLPDSKIVYAVGTDKSIKEIENGKAREYLAGANISQIQLMSGGRTLFAGVAEDDKPGSILILRLPFEKVSEVQAHSLPIERIRISQDS